MATVLDIIKSAMRKGGFLAKGETPSSDESVDGMEMLNDLLASLANESILVYSRTTETFSLSGGVGSYTIGASATFNTTRPIRIVSAYVRSGEIDYPLSIVNDEQYASIPFKTSSGIPKFLNYSNAFPQATIRLYPVPSSTYSLILVSEKQITSFTSLSDTVSLPPGWERMLKYNLALELCPEYGQQASAEIVKVAQESKAAIKASIMAAKPMQWNSGLGNPNNIYSGYWS